MSPRYYVAVSLLHVAFGIAVVEKTLQSTNRKIRKFALRVGGVEEEKPLTPEQIEAIIRKRDETKPDKYSIDLTTWKGDDGSPVVELLEMTPERFSALEYTANAKHMTVATLLGEVVRQAVGV